MNDDALFHAIYDSGAMCLWRRPQTWRHVFTCFKKFGRYEGKGFLFCNGVLVRETGRADLK